MVIKVVQQIFILNEKYATNDGSSSWPKPTSELSYMLILRKQHTPIFINILFIYGPLLQDILLQIPMNYPLIQKNKWESISWTH